MTVSTALLPLQTAVYQRLSSDPLVSGMVTGVYDVVAAEHVFPYLTIGEPNMLPIETKDTYNEEISLVIHAWSIYAGKKEAYQLLDAILKAIGKGLSIEGPFTLLKIKKPSMNVIDDADPRIKHGIARFTFTIKNN